MSFREMVPNGDTRYWYRYCSLKPQSHSIENVIANKVYFQKAVNFNDPFDSSCGFASETEEEYQLGVKKFIEIEYSKDTDDKKRKLYAQFLHPEWRDKAQAGFRIEHEKNLRENIGILSLANEKNSIPMWGYYADSHKGICLKLDMRTVCEELRRKRIVFSFGLVNYVDELPKVGFMRPFLSPGIRDAKQEYMDVLFSKSIQWKHEEEARLIIPEYAGKEIAFERPIYTAIILGTNGLGNLNGIKGEIRKNGLDGRISLEMAIKTPGKYALSFQDQPI